MDLADDPALESLKGDARFQAQRRRLLDFVRKEQAELGSFEIGGRRSGQPVWR
jgi:hypothetical protein